MAHRGGDVVGGHKDGAQHQAAAKEVAQHPLKGVVAPGKEEGQGGYRADIADGNIPGDNLPPQEEQAAKEEEHGAHFTHGAAHQAHEHLGQVGDLHQAGEVVAVEIGHGGREGLRIDDAQEGNGGPGADPGGHLAGPGEHEGPGRQGGIQKVLADAAEELKGSLAGFVLGGGEKRRLTDAVSSVSVTFKPEKGGLKAIVKVNGKDSKKNIMQSILESHD